jgi:hypothetical protein
MSDQIRKAGRHVSQNEGLIFEKLSRCCGRERGGAEREPAGEIPSEARDL